MLVLVVGVLGFIYGTERAQEEFTQLVASLLPVTGAQEARIARELVSGRAISLGIGLIGTLVGATAIFGAVETAIGRIIPGAKRSFVRGRVEGLIFVAGLILLAVASFAFSYGAQAAEGVLKGVLTAAASRFVVALLSQLLGFVAGGVFFYAVFRYLPRQPFPPRFARSAALVSAVLWELAKVGFALYTRALGAFAAYGPIAFAAGLMTWIYLTAVIILLGAETMKVRAKA
jgi:membrane protein